MNQPLDRDKQIEIMRGAAERMEANVARWVRTPQIRAALKRKVVDQPVDDYSEQTVRIARCG